MGESGVSGSRRSPIARTEAEIPFAILFTIPAMLVITPIWLTQLAMGKMRGDD